MRALFSVNYAILCGIFVFLVVGHYFSWANAEDKLEPELIVELTDEKYDQIQRGLWLIGFFDKETKESLRLEEDWKVFAFKCKEQNINVGRILAPSNPALYVRFLVTVFPKVFFIKNGVAHEVKQPSREKLIDLIKDKKWAELKPVNFLSNPFSVQMSLLSHLFVHAVNLYNYEDAIVQKFVPFSSATDIAFGLTFIIVGTSLGLVLTCAFGVLQIFLMDSKDSDEDDVKEEKKVKKSPNKKDKKSHGKKDSSTSSESERESEEEENEPLREDTNVRKRK